MAREAVRERMYGLIKKVRLSKLRGLKKPAQAEQPETTSEAAPPADDLDALEKMLTE
jgi:hypothetical protein